MPGEPNRSETITAPDSGEGHAVTRGPQVIAMDLTDNPDSWLAAGFSVEADGVCRIGSVSFRLTGSTDVGGTGFRSWSFRGIDPDVASIDGLAVDHAPVVEEGARSVPHPNGVTSIDHIVVSSGNPERTIAALEGAGFPIRGKRRATNLKAPMVQHFFWAGDVILELIGPGDGESRTDEPSSIFGLAFVSPDLTATAEFLGDLISEPRTAVQKGRRIATLRTRNVGISLPIAVMSPHPS